GLVLTDALLFLIWIVRCCLINTESEVHCQLLIQLPCVIDEYSVCLHPIIGRKWTVQGLDKRRSFETISVIEDHLPNGSLLIVSVVIDVPGETRLDIVRSGNEVIGHQRKFELVLPSAPVVG